MDAERQRRLWLAEQIERRYNGRLSRRRFLQAALMAGLGSLLLPACRRVEPHPVPRDRHGPESVLSSEELRSFLTEMGRRFKGTRLKLVSEDTPPSIATRQIMMEEFVPLTGIEVEWETLPLDRVLGKLASDTARRIGLHDIFYVDQQWVARFAEDFVSPTALFEKSDIAYPGYDFSDILPQLVEHLATYRGELVGIPYDITIEIMIYRRDLFERFNLTPPRTRAEALSIARWITKETGSEVYGTSGMWKAGHLALYIEFVGLLWGHGGSVYRSNGEPSLDDEPTRATLAYMRELSEAMSPAVTTWDWAEEAEAFARGRTAFSIQPGEYLAMFNDPQRSRVAGLVDVAPCPRASALRPPSECGYSETPGVSHQGGSLLCISRYSRQIDAAWVFVQWATSRDVTTRACILGGGASPIRASNYSDPRVLELGRSPTGPTHHFPVALDAIRHDMGSDPKLPEFPDIAVNGLAVELGKFTTGQHSIEESTRQFQRLARVL